MRVHWLNGQLCLKPETLEEHCAVQRLGEFFAGLGYPVTNNSELPFALGGGRKVVERQPLLEGSDDESVPAGFKVQDLPEPSG